MNERSSSANKNMMWVMAALVLVVVGGLYFANQQSQKAEQAKMEQDKAVMKAKEDTASSEKAAMEKDKKMDGGKDEAAQMAKSDSRYVVYSKVAFDQAADKRRVLYFFANWCPICRPADASIKENASRIPQDLVVIRVNYNDSDTDQEEKDLEKKYGITYQHTFVQIDAKGNPVTKWNGGQIDELLANIK